eukprot:7055858-Alexandrium_andersonii.AAC.1
MVPPPHGAVPFLVWWHERTARLAPVVPPLPGAVAAGRPPLAIGSVPCVPVLRAPRCAYLSAPLTRTWQE